VALEAARSSLETSLRNTLRVTRAAHTMMEDDEENKKR
jgi:hypothetical protein